MKDSSNSNTYLDPSIVQTKPPKQKFLKKEVLLSKAIEDIQRILIFGPFKFYFFKERAPDIIWKQKLPPSVMKKKNDYVLQFQTGDFDSELREVLNKYAITMNVISKFFFIFFYFNLFSLFEWRLQWNNRTKSFNFLMDATVLDEPVPEQKNLQSTCREALAMIYKKSGLNK